MEFGILCRHIFLNYSQILISTGPCYDTSWIVRPHKLTIFISRSYNVTAYFIRACINILVAPVDPFRFIIKFLYGFLLPHA